MKKILTLLFISVFALTSCGDDGAIGPQGPQGPQGLPGLDGEDGLIGSVIDLQGSFTSANDYSLSLDFNDQGMEVFESDVVLVYLKTAEDGEAGGLPVEVFRMLPQTYFIDGQILQYNFDFTFFDVVVFLDGTADFAALDPTFTENQVLRIVVVPAEFAETSGIDLSNMKAVMSALDIQPADIKKGEIK